MELFCVFCGCIAFFRWICDRVGRGGETWETYECEKCGNERSFCTK